MMMKFIIFCSLIVVIMASSTTAEMKSCSEGPEYWCSSIQNSLECRSFQHCLSTVWTKHSQFFSNNNKNVKELIANKPNKCQNCLMCLESNNPKCPVLHNYEEQINQLKLNEITNSKVCELLEQCDAEVQDEVKVEEESSKKSDASCDFCVFIVKKLQAILEQNSTEVDIETYLKNFCTLLPTKDEAQLCIKTVDDYLPQIYAMLKANVDAGIVCKVLKLCPKQQQQQNVEVIQIKNVKIRILNPHEVKVKTPLSESVSQATFSEQKVKELGKLNGVACDLCSIVMEAVDYMLANKAEQQMAVDFIKEQLCAKLGKFNATCSSLVEEEAQKIFNMISAVNPTAVCRRIDMCRRQQVPIIEDLVAQNNLNCTLCKMTMNQVKKKLMSNESQYHILDYIDKNLCSKAGKQKEMCHTLLDTYGPLFLEIIAKDINAQQICQILGFCTASFDSDEIKPLIKPSDIDSHETCVLCEFVLSVLTKYINQNSSEPEIEKWLEYVCDTEMPKPIRNECSNFVETYGPVIISLLIKQVDPDKICKTIGLCPKAADISLPRIDLTKNLERKPVVYQLEAKNSSCAICEFALNIITQYVGMNSTEPEVQKWLQYVCDSVMPKPIRNECSLFVQEYGPIVIPLLIKEINPEKICQLVRACPKSSSIQQPETVEEILIQPASPVVPAIRPKKYRGTTCGLCKIIMEYAKAKMEIDSTERLFRFTVENICQIVPTRLRSECESFVDKYGARAVEILNDSTDPEKVCEHIMACEKPETVIKEQKSKLNDLIVVKQQDILVSNVKNGSLECSLCIYLAEIADGLLKQNKTDQEIVQEFKKVCNLLPAAFKPQCSAFLEEYGPYVIQLVAADLDPASACTALRLCGKQKTALEARYNFLRHLRKNIN